MKKMMWIATGVLLGAAIVWYVWEDMPMAMKADVVKMLRTVKIPYVGTGSYREKEISRAERNVRILFASAQNTFIHRNGKRMAKSIDELGAGYRVGQNGTLIYEDIWVSRYNATANGKTSDVEKNILSRPYRYAVVPVEGLRDPENDARTTCIVALSIDESYPDLVMVAGPVVADPDDFIKKWDIVHIEGREQKTAVRKMIDASIPYGTQMHKLVYRK